MGAADAIEDTFFVSIVPDTQGIDTETTHTEPVRGYQLSRILAIQHDDVATLDAVRQLHQRSVRDVRRI